MNLSGKKILIIDDHRLFADGLSAMLNQQGSGMIINTRYNARVLLDDYGALNSYHVVLIDLDMPSINGFDFLTAVNKRGASFKLLVVSGSENTTDVENALRLGANGFVPKHLPSEEILAAIKQVLSGQRFLPRNLAETINWSACLSVNSQQSKSATKIEGLRSRQLEVLRLMQEGHSNSKIGTILGISESAVKSHVSILFKALQVCSRTAAVKVGVELDLI